MVSGGMLNMNGRASSCPCLSHVLTISSPHWARSEPVPIFGESQNGPFSTHNRKWDNNMFYMFLITYPRVNERRRGKWMKMAHLWMKFHIVRLRANDSKWTRPKSTSTKTPPKFGRYPPANQPALENPTMYIEIFGSPVMVQVDGDFPSHGWFQNINCSTSYVSLPEDNDG